MTECTDWLTNLVNSTPAWQWVVTGAVLFVMFCVYSYARGYFGELARLKAASREAQPGD